MKILIPILMLVATGVFAQSPEPELARIKIAADAGDPVAQCKLAEHFLVRQDSAQAELLYRKSAAQGYAYAQGKLGNMLLMRSRMSIGIKPDARMAMGQEALRWVGLAASQGDKQGEADLASICLEGKLVKQDLIQAYKWGDLAAQGSSINVATISGRGTRDAAILKMNAAQIEEARRQVAAFVPRQSQKSDELEPVWVQDIKLGGISGQPDNRLAVINNRTFGKGDKINLKLGGKRAVVHCLEIRESSVVIEIEGLPGTRELKMP